MTTKDQHTQWLAHPTGSIGKGEYCSCCNRFNSRTLATNAILLDGQKILLVKRGEEPDKGWWDIPGGYLGWDETLEEGAARELQEETNLIVDPKDLRLFDIFSNPKNKAKNQVVDVYLVSKKFSGAISADRKEVIAAQWFDLHNLPENIAFNHRITLEKLRRQVDRKQ